MAYLGTTTSDPYFYQNRMAQLSQTLGGVSDRWRQRREQRHQKDLAEIDRVMAYMSKYPELADTLGDSLRVRFKEYPEVGAMVDVFRNASALKRELPAAGQRWESELQGLETDYAKRSAQAAAQPEAVPFPLPMGGMVPFPNLSKIKAEHELAQVNPDLFQSQALQKLAPSTRRLARTWAKDQGSPIFEPTPFEPKRLPAEVEAIYQIDKLPLEAQQAARIKIGLMNSPAQAEYMGFVTGERVASAEQKHSERLAQEKFQREIADKRHGLSMTRIGASRAGGRGGEGTGEKAAKREGLDWKSIQGEAATRTKSYDDQMKSELTALRPREKVAAKRRFQAENGARPVAMPEGVARRIATGAQRRVAAGELSPEQAREEAASLTRRWQDLAQKVGAGKAMNQLLGKDIPPPPPSPAKETKPAATAKPAGPAQAPPAPKETAPADSRAAVVAELRKHPLYAKASKEVVERKADQILSEIK